MPGVAGVAGPSMLTPVALRVAGVVREIVEPIQRDVRQLTQAAGLPADADGSSFLE